MSAITLLSRWMGTAQVDGLLDRSRAWVELDLSALRHNIHSLKRLLPPQMALWAVVKANAYGHGAQLVAAEAVTAGAAGFCVATLAEGVELREAGITIPILILGALNTRLEIQEAQRYQLEVTLTHLDQIPLLLQIAREQAQPLPLHMNVDTGMTRLGIPWQQAATVWADLGQLAEFDCRSLYSHFATADEPDHPQIQQQQQRFQQVLQTLQTQGVALPALHMDNSAATLLGSQQQVQRVRVGLAMYGLAPAPHLAGKISLRPLLSVKARITHLQSVPEGTGVSYGHHYVTPRPTRLATVAIGYADGIPRRLSNWLQGLLHGQKIQQVGMITMDQCMWDVTKVSDVQVGDVVELLGGDLTVQQWADYLGTIPYEVLCGLSARLPRVGRDDS
ncbi:MAG: alanine racemase [Synechococcaceae cyanobacterium SM2_3_1]|nr:alanine racemase [Synechococcaceae cyanobacterium SM2_3_1]